MKTFLTNTIVLLLSLFIYVTECKSQKIGDGISFEASYVSEYVANINGGIKKGSDYLGMIDLMATFDTEAAGLWNKGSFFVQLENTHGGTPSGTYIGDYQVVSNIENGYYTYLYQLWYNQQVNNFSFLVGLHDLNSEFLASDYAGEYINSSFGIMPSVSSNVPVAIFPKTTLGGIVRYEASENLFMQAAIYDGDPMCLDTDPYFKNFELSKEEGFISIGEVAMSTLKAEGYNGTLKLGGYYHSADCYNIKDTVVELSGNYGAYFILDQIVVPFNENDLRGVGMFLYGGWAPSDRNEANYSWGIGFNLMAPFASRPDDIVGIGIASVNVNNVQDDLTVATGSETAIECMYKLRVHNNILIQPEIQYIVNPGAGTSGSLSNATVGLIRAYFEF